ncbi:MAG: class I SAM-dependent methyltransferase [Methanomicrobiales archaeon]|nr:class I SAM-dependent methyltransferase [Methanomicrobiales archaeon]
MDDQRGLQGWRLPEGDAPWKSENAVRFYRHHRHTVDELYPSERHFLSVIARPDTRILDIGCAAGGFSHIIGQREPSIRYTGIDISRKMISQARACYPETPFLIASGYALPFRSVSFDTAICFGTLHMALSWRKILAECWRVVKEYLVFDIRLIDKGNSVEDARISYERIAFLGEWDGISVVPYVVLNVDDFIAVVHDLDPRPQLRQVYGYYHPVSSMAVSPYRDVCMTACCLGKRESPRLGNTWNVPLHRGITG